MAIDFAALQKQLDRLDWGDGLTRDGIRLRLGHLPEDVYLHLPSEKEFTSAEEVLQFYRRAVRRAEERDIDDESLSDGAPPAWGDSPTGTTIARPDLGHGIGSGAHPGYTGGGSAQISPGREGTTYGDEHSSPLPDD